MPHHPISTEDCCEKVLNYYNITHDSQQESPVQTLAYAMGQFDISYEEAIDRLVTVAIEAERKSYTLVDAVAGAIAERGDPEVAEYIRGTEPDDDLWNNYLGPMLDSLQEDYAKSLANSGDEVFAGYQLIPLSEDLVRVYRNDDRTDVYRQDADPEHRLPAYRMAARWFGNARQEEQEDDIP